MSKLNKKAFTLIELIVVITVLGVLVLLATPRLLGYTEEAQLVRIQNDVKVMEDKMAETLAQSSESYDSWDNNSKDLGTLILRSQLFDKEGLASSVNVEHLMSKGSNLASLNSEANGPGIGGELYSIGISSTDENLESDESDLSLDPSAGYKIVPESFKNEINTKLDGTFYVNKFGKVYYEHEKPISSAKQEQVLACVPAESLDYEFDGYTGTITKYNGSLQHIIIPGAFEIDGECVPVRSIGAGAFMNGGFKEITIPQSVKEIEENAFKGNELEEIEIPHSVDYIGQDAFSNNRIESVVINKGSDNITIGTGAFSNNGPTGTSTVSPTYRLPTPSDLKVVFNKSSGTIVSGYGASSGGSYGSSFSGGSSSSSGGSSINSSKQYDNSNRFISIPEEVIVDGEVHEVKEVAKGAFQGQGIIHVEFPNSLERIEDYAFAGNQLVGVQIPESIGHIGNYAFAFNEINEERTINYVNILDERNYEPQIDKLGNIAEGGSKVNLLANRVSLLDFIFVTSKANVEIPDTYIAERPTAVITMSPMEGLTPETKITWGYENSTDPDNLDIIEAEWKGADEFKEVGEHTTRLRVKNSSGVWSEWTEVTFIVKRIPISDNISNEPSGKEWIVPKTGTYKFTVSGAKGGHGGRGYQLYRDSGGFWRTRYPAGKAGSTGASITGEVDLKEGEKIVIYTGEKGGDGPNATSHGRRGGNGGFGGYSAIELNNNKLIIAEGGNGGTGGTGSISIGSGTNGKPGKGANHVDNVVRNHQITKSNKIDGYVEIEEIIVD